MKVRRVAIIGTLGAAALVGCSSQQGYGAGQAWQRNECFKINDQQERSRCLDRASIARERYQRDASRAAEGL